MTGGNTNHYTTADLLLGPRRIEPATSNALASFKTHWPPNALILMGLRPYMHSAKTDRRDAKTKANEHAASKHTKPDTQAQQSPAMAFSRTRANNTKKQRNTETQKHRNTHIHTHKHTSAHKHSNTREQTHHTNTRIINNRPPCKQGEASRCCKSWVDENSAAGN